ncbi:hypothetical protein Tco_1268975 [Tanacetum coccineum]
MRSLLLMAMRLLVLISPKWSATTATRGDILLGSAELQEIKTTRTRKAQEGVEGPIITHAYSSLSSDSEEIFMPQHLTCQLPSLMSVIKSLVVANCKAHGQVEEEPKVGRKNDDARIINEWVSDSEEENVSQTKTEKKTAGKPGREQCSKGDSSTNFAKKTHPNANRTNGNPKAVTNESGLVLLNTAEK